ncbi:MAG: hypothetical protein U9N84_14535 [Actinomycetota bacterium]|nr:hypothetical protein [Actinomycetota bacterium]
MTEVAESDALPPIRPQHLGQRRPGRPPTGFASQVSEQRPRRVGLEVDDRRTVTNHFESAEESDL